MPPGPTPCWGPGAVPGEWTDVCGVVKHPNSYDLWKVRLHGAFTIPCETLGLRPRYQSCHYEVWLHLDLVSNRYTSRKGPKAGTTMKVTIRFHPSHPFVSSCFHEQQVRRVKNIQL